ncbi:unnamed protein product [Clavelina lepadiformis]|uniref:TIR domain-containing protein n=1 Tax=Clavelina lepadiformis TaxID=159417 RepID=A0ABP0GS57_CLALP
MTEADSVPFSPSSNDPGVGPSSIHNSSPSTNSRIKFDVGIFNHHLDQGVNRRVKPIIESLGYCVGTFDSYNHPAGGAYQAKCVNFVQECHCIFWVASSNSIHDRGYIKFYRDMSQNKAIKSGRCDTFITLLPRDCLNLDLPWELDTFVPLKENDQFEEQVKCTLDKILGESGFPLPQVSHSTAQQRSETSSHQTGHSNANVTINVTIRDANVGAISIGEPLDMKATNATEEENNEKM